MRPQRCVLPVCRQLETKPSCVPTASPKRRPLEAHSIIQPSNVSLACSLAAFSPQRAGGYTIDRSVRPTKRSLSSPGSIYCLVLSTASCAHRPRNLSKVGGHGANVQWSSLTLIMHISPGDITCFGGCYCPGTGN